MGVSAQLACLAIHRGKRNPTVILPGDGADYAPVLARKRRVRMIVAITPRTTPAIMNQA